jgi:methylated-DNA-protein-cysteine methyltransferase-like protein
VIADDEFEAAVTAAIEDLGQGEISTYGEIAAEAGYPGAARAVGNLLRTSNGLSWWRVISASGRLVPGAEAEHAQRLRAEGIRITKGRVSMRDMT